MAPLTALADLALRHDAWLMSDDAHGLGVLGGGRGSAHVQNPPAEVPLQMGTLSKAVGAYGGYLCASRPVIDLIRTRARSFVYSTGLPPGTIAAAIAALNLIARDPAYCALPVAKARAFARAAGLPKPASPRCDMIGHVTGDFDVLWKYPSAFEFVQQRRQRLFYNVGHNVEAAARGAADDDITHAMSDATRQDGIEPGHHGFGTFRAKAFFCRKPAIEELLELIRFNNTLCRGATLIDIGFCRATFRHRVKPRARRMIVDMPAIETDGAAVEFLQFFDETPQGRIS